jgi:N-acetyl sugar amidotransferase
MQEIPYSICANCIMDTTDECITFDEEGVCNHCRSYEEIERAMPSPEEREAQLQQLVDKIRKTGEGNRYDCAIGMSGGVDSSYLAYLASSRGLRPLAVHVDAGWNSELAVNNIENIVKALDIDLFTFVVDWKEMQDLQAAFLRSGVANQDIPQDHAFVAGVYRTASKHGIKYVLSGGNNATEGILPKSWGYNALDLRHLKAIHKRFGRRRLVKYPTVNFFQYYIYYPYIRGIRSARLLNYIDYNKSAAMDLLTNELGWQYYGGKHFESRYTKFFQSYYLPERFGYDKRRAHLSSLIVSGQLDRDSALEEMERPSYSLEALREEEAYIIKKLGLREDEYESIRRGPKRTYRDFPSSVFLFDLKDRAKAILARG